MVPAIALRMQYGSAVEVREAAEWVEYMNGDETSRWGRERAKRGHKEPYNVRYW